MLVKQLFLAIQVCSVKWWSPQHTCAPGAIRLRSTCLHAPQPDECTCCYRCHQYCWKDIQRRQMWTVGVWPCTQTTSCYAHQSWACLSINGYCRHCGWAAGLQRCVPCSDRCCVNYRHASCSLAQYRLISGRCDIVSKLPFTAAKNPRIWIRMNCGKVRGFGCELGICNNSIYLSLTIHGMLLLNCGRVCDSLEW